MGIFTDTQRNAVVFRLWKFVPVLAGYACLFTPPMAHAAHERRTVPFVFAQQPPTGVIPPAGEPCAFAESPGDDSCMVAQPPLAAPEPGVYAETMPSFEGGALPAFQRWVCRQIEYPAEAFRQKREGRVVCSFVVETDGTVSSVRVVSSPDSLLSAEVERAVSLSPRWTPGRQGEESVRVRLMLPVDFRLQQQDDPAAPTAGKKTDSGPDIDTLPRFKGGDINVFREWVVSRLRYPAKALNRTASGRVVCSFAVETDGSVSSVQVLRSSDAALSKETVRVVSSSPRWTPGVHEGKAVRVRYNLPVDFRLQDLDGYPPLAPIDGEIICCGLADEEADSEEVHYPHVLPRFEGRPIDAFLHRVETQIRYPAEAFRKKKAGRVVCTFVIDTDGSVTSVEVLASADAALSEEVVRLVSGSPRWTPGVEDGKKVPVRLKLVVDFRIAAAGRSDLLASKKRTATFDKAGDTEQALSYVEVMPRFKGKGVDAFTRWAYSHLRYPKEAVEERVQGCVSCTFVVDTDGSVTSVQILQSPHPALSEEIERLIASSPRWTPGRQEGRAVKVRFNWSVGFSLEGWEPPVEAGLEEKKRSMEERLLRPHYDIPWGWH